MWETRKGKGAEGASGGGERVFPPGKMLTPTSISSSPVPSQLPLLLGTRTQPLCPASQVGQDFSLQSIPA